MSSSNPPSNHSEEEATKDEHREDVGSSTGQGRKLTPLPLSNPGAKPGQNLKTDKKYHFEHFFAKIPTEKGSGSSSFFDIS